MTFNQEPIKETSMDKPQTPLKLGDWIEGLTDDFCCSGGLGKGGKTQITGKSKTGLHLISLGSMYWIAPTDENVRFRRVDPVAESLKKWVDAMEKPIKNHGEEQWGGLPETMLESKLKNETKENKMKYESALVIETKTFANGLDVAKIKDHDIAETILAHREDIAELEALNAIEPVKKIANQIAKRKAALTAFIAAVNAIE
jgi:hypothetical protein